jgi:hypothetical protein
MVRVMVRQVARNVNQTNVDEICGRDSGYSGHEKEKEGNCRDDHVVSWLSQPHPWGPVRSESVPIGFCGWFADYAPD